MKFWNKAKPFVMTAIIAYAGWLAINYLLARFAPKAWQTANRIAGGELPGVAI